MTGPMHDERSACCGAISDETRSPFEIVELEWKDGVAAGLARCRCCGQAYAFDTVASSGAGLRVYAFARIGADHYAAVVRALESPGLSAADLDPSRARAALVDGSSMQGRGDRDLLAGIGLPHCHPIWIGEAG